VLGLLVVVSVSAWWVSCWLVGVLCRCPLFVVSLLLCVVLLCLSLLGVCLLLAGVCCIRGWCWLLSLLLKVGKRERRKKDNTK